MILQFIFVFFAGMKNKCVDCRNENCLLKKAGIVDKIDDVKSVYSLGKGQFVFKENFQFDGVYIIKEGKAKVVSFGYKNKIQGIRLTRNGDMLGYRAIGKNVFSNSAITLDNSILCYIEGELFYDLLKSESSLVYNLMLFYAEELRMAELRMKKLSQMTVTEKVVDAILLAYGIYGSNSVGDNREIEAPLSRNDIAEIAGIRLDQLVKVFSFLKESKIVDYNNKKHIRIYNYEYLLDCVKDYL